MAALNTSRFKFLFYLIRHVAYDMWAIKYTDHTDIIACRQYQK